MGTAQVQGELWGARVQDWAEIQEGTLLPAYTVIFDTLPVGNGTRLLDVGCGSGLAAQLAASRGASVSGLDASTPSIEMALQRVPNGQFTVGEMEELPYADATFDAVTSFNAFQYAADPVHALSEARRIVKAGGKVAMVIWGRPQDCEHAATLAAVSACLPPPPPGAAGPFALSEPGKVEQLMQEAGLTPVTSGEVACPFEYADEETALKGLCSAGPMVRAIRHAGEAKVQQAIRESLMPYKTSTRGYCQQNLFRYVIAMA